jgi:hypothetical protein
MHDVACHGQPRMPRRNVRGTGRFVMNWKIVATLIVGALLVTACGAQQQSAAPPSEPRGVQQPGAAPGGTIATPAPAAPKDAKKDVVMHE